MVNRGNGIQRLFAVTLRRHARGDADQALPQFKTEQQLEALKPLAVALGYREIEACVVDVL